MDLLDLKYLEGLGFLEDLVDQDLLDPDYLVGLLGLGFLEDLCYLVDLVGLDL